MQCSSGMTCLLPPVAGLAGGRGVARAARTAAVPVEWRRPCGLDAGCCGQRQHTGGGRGRRGETGPNPRTDRGKLGRKHHVLTDAQGTPLAAILTGANRHDAM